MHGAQQSPFRRHGGHQSPFQTHGAQQSPFRTHGAQQSRFGGTVLNEVVSEASEMNIVPPQQQSAPWGGKQRTTTERTKLVS